MLAHCFINCLKSKKFSNISKNCLEIIQTNCFEMTFSFAASINNVILLQYANGKVSSRGEISDEISCGS